MPVSVSQLTLTSGDLDKFRLSARALGSGPSSASAGVIHCVVRSHRSGRETSDCKRVSRLLAATKKSRKKKPSCRKKSRPTITMPLRCLSIVDVRAVACGPALDLLYTHSVFGRRPVTWSDFRQARRAS
ncbi:hypothetical protein MRX96_003939 [Rhipicephalus microplus]